METLIKILKAVGLPFAYDHFAEGESPEPPFICYLTPGSDNFAADGQVYFKIDDYHIELYTDFKDLAVEAKLEEALDAASIFYNKSETWIESEKLYEVLYQFELEVPLSLQPKKMRSKLRQKRSPLQQALFLADM